MKNTPRIISNKLNHITSLNRGRYFIAASVAMALAVMGNSCSNGFVENARLPVNAQKTCEASISPWFTAGEISKGGSVNPANSLAPIFADSKNNTRCDFYKWGAQMFLWLTSEDGSRHVFNTSPKFYNLSVKSKGERQFLTENGPMQMAIRKGKMDDEIEAGQAGNSDALLAQNNTIVYYGLHTNAVYTMFTTQQKNIILPKCENQYKQCASTIVGECLKKFNACKVAAINNIEFPNTQTELNNVLTYAKSYGYPIGNEKIALAMELKTSWIDASEVADQSRYVLSQAVVPVFDRSKANGPWTVSGAEEKTLALVGIHIVGSVNKHPEMVWSTFEHVDNVPDNAYVYNLSANNTSTQAYNSAGKAWSFLPDGAAKPTSITANAHVNTDTHGSLPQQIVSKDDSAIRSTDVIRVDPWGNLHGSKSGSAEVANNTDLVSINFSVLSQLSAGDVRGNYIQTGGVWTVKGQIPNGGTDKNLRGSLNLANTTMETYYQYHTSGFNPKNCFGCHSSSATNATGISHVFNELQPLSKK